MQANVVYVDFHQKTLKKMEEFVVRSPRKQVLEYKTEDFIQEAKLMSARCKEVMLEFLGWEDIEE